MTVTEDTQVSDDSAVSEDIDTQTHIRTCPLCEACCGLEITTRGDQVVRIRGDRNDPYSKGFICPKGSTLKQLHEDPDRLTAPVVKRDGDWVQVTWAEAFAEIETRFNALVDTHGRTAVTAVLGNPNVHNLGGQLYGGVFLRALGASSLYTASTVDQMPKHVTSGLLWGDADSFPLPDVDNADYLLMLGANPHASNGSLVTLPDFPGRLDAMQERGGRLVVVDPRVSRTAERADEHLTIRPGTDVLWLLSLIDVIFSEDLVDLGRVADHVTGLDDVRAVAANYPPQVTAPITGIDEAATRRIARELAAAPTAAVYGRIGTHTVEFGTLSSWAVDVLNTITGNLDRPGGIVFGAGPSSKDQAVREPGGRGFQIGRWTSRVSGVPEVKGEFPVARLAEEMEVPGEGQIRGMFLLACNPVRSFPNSQRLDEAFQNLDLLVAIDPYINASSRHADVILPPPSALERSHYDLAFEGSMIRSFAKYSPAVFSPEGPDEPEILSRLALVVSGMGTDVDPTLAHEMALDALIERELKAEHSPIHGRDKAEILAALDGWSWAEQLLDFRLRVGRFGEGFGARPDGLTLQKLIDNPHGIDFGPVTRRFPGGIRTPSGKIELAPAPVIADLDRLAAADFATEGLVLVGRRHLRSCNTWMHNVNVLIKGRERCTLQINPTDAADLGVTEGAEATVRSRVGEVTAPVEITEAVMAGVVSLPFGWGYDEPGIEMHTARTRPGVNSNVLTDDATFDVLSGNAVLNGIAVEVAPA